MGERLEVSVAAGYQNLADADIAVLQSILLGHEVDLQELEERVDELEARFDDVEL